MEFYEVTFRYEDSEPDQQGKMKLKVITEHYLIEAKSCTEAERICIDKLRVGSAGFKVINVKVSSIKGVIRQEKLQG